MTSPALKRILIFVPAIACAFAHAEERTAEQTAPSAAQEAPAPKPQVAPKEAVAAFLAALERGDAKSALAHVSPDAIAKKRSAFAGFPGPWMKLQEWKAAFEKEPNSRASDRMRDSIRAVQSRMRFAAISARPAGTESIEGNRATVEADVLEKKGVFRLVRANGTWLVDGFEYANPVPAAAKNEIKFARLLTRQFYENATPERAVLNFFRACGDGSWDLAAERIGGGFSEWRFPEGGMNKASFLRLLDAYRRKDGAECQSLLLAAVGKENPKAVEFLRNEPEFDGVMKIGREIVQSAEEDFSNIADTMVLEPEKCFSDKKRASVVFTAYGRIRRVRVKVDLVQWGGWRIERIEETAIPPATADELAAMRAEVEKRGLLKEDGRRSGPRWEKDLRTEPFFGIYADMDKAPFRMETDLEQRARQCWELIRLEEPDASLEAVRLVLRSDRMWKEDVRNIRFGNLVPYEKRPHVDGRLLPLKKGEANVVDRFADALRWAILTSESGTSLGRDHIKTLHAIYGDAQRGTLTRLVLRGTLSRHMSIRDSDERMEDILAWLSKTPICEEQSDFVAETLAGWLSGNLETFRKAIDVLKSTNSAPWMIEYLLGVVARREGWNARGGGYAYTVTEEGWKVFNERLPVARKHFQKAKELHPTSFLPPTALLDVAISHGSHEECIRCYKDVVATCPDAASPFKKLAWSFMPRWGGSWKTIFALTKEALKQDETKSNLPFLGFHQIAYLFAVERDMDWSIKNFYRNPIVRDGGDRLFALYSPRRENNVEYGQRIHFHKAGFCFAAQKYLEAETAFVRAGARNTDSSPQTFTANYARWSAWGDMPNALCIAQIGRPLMVFASPVGVEARKIERDWLDGVYSSEKTRARLLELCDADAVRKNPELPQRDSRTLRADDLRPRAGSFQTLQRTGSGRRLQGGRDAARHGASRIPDGQRLRSRPRLRLL